MSKNLQVLADPTLFFFLKMKKFDFKKNYNYGIKAPLKSHSCIFFEINFFSFPKKITSVGWSNRCKFFWNPLDPTLVIFLTFFEKNYNDWIKGKLSKSQTKWTGLVFAVPIFRKVHIFWEGHKILRNLPLTFDYSTYSQKLEEDFAKFCGLLRIYEL